jgi:hypothetical protein
VESVPRFQSKPLKSLGDPPIAVLVVDHPVLEGCMFSLLAEEPLWPFLEFPAGSAGREGSTGSVGRRKHWKWKEGRKHWKCREKETLEVEGGKKAVEV